LIQGVVRSICFLRSYSGTFTGMNLCLSKRTVKVGRLPPAALV
jgi:hypothetical protein